MLVNALEAWHSQNQLTFPLPQADTYSQNAPLPGHYPILIYCYQGRYQDFLSIHTLGYHKSWVLRVNDRTCLHSCDGGQWSVSPSYVRARTHTHTRCCVYNVQCTYIHIHIDLGTTCIASDSPLPLKGCQSRHQTYQKRQCLWSCQGRTFMQLLRWGQRKLVKQSQKIQETIERSEQLCS